MGIKLFASLKNHDQAPEGDYASPSGDYSSPQGKASTEHERTVIPLLHLIISKHYHINQAPMRESSRREEVAKEGQGKVKLLSGLGSW